MCSDSLGITDTGSREHLIHSIFPKSNSAATGHDTGDKTVRVCWFMDGLGVQYDARHS